MVNYVIEVFESEKQHSGPKAKMDVIHFLKQRGFHRILIDSQFKKLSKLIFYPSYLNNKVKQINSDDLVVIQHPMNIGKEFEWGFINKLKKKKCKIIVLVHDISSFRHENRLSIKEEIRFFNLSAGVIVHNNFMNDYLRHNGLTVKTTSLGVFDYYFQGNRVNHSSITFPISVNYAGNINKSKFVSLLPTSEKVHYEIFGPLDKKEILENSGGGLTYHGSLDPTIIPLKLKNGFGLVWDGDSIQTCTGIYGSYLKINNPHKASLYLAAGIPVIVWDKSAMAEFVIKNKVGIVIKNVAEIESKISVMSSDELNTIAKNVSKIQSNIRNGYYITNSLNKIVNGGLGDD